MTHAEYHYVKSAARYWYDCDRSLDAWSEDERESFAIFAGQEAKAQQTMDVHLPSLFRAFSDA